MKKLITFLMVTALVLSMSMISSFAAEEDLVIDIATLKTNVRDALAEWPDAGYTGIPVVQLMNYGEFINLGKIDLSKYESITIKYGRDTSHKTDPNAGIVFANKAIQNGDSTIVEDAIIYADFTSVMDKTSKSGSWKDFQPGELTVNIDSSKYTADTDVILGVKVLPCPGDCIKDDSNPAIGFAIESIVFNAKTEQGGQQGGEQSGQQGGEQSGEQSGQQGGQQGGESQNPPSGDTTSVLFILAATAMMATVIIKKKAY